MAIKISNNWDSNLYAALFYVSGTHFVVRLTNNKPSQLYVNSTFILFTRYTIEAFRVLSNGVVPFSGYNHQIIISTDPPVTEVIWPEDRSYLDIKLKSTWCYYNFIGSSIGSLKFTQIPWYDPEE